MCFSIFFHLASFSKLNATLKETRPSLINNNAHMQWLPSFGKCLHKTNYYCLQSLLTFRSFCMKYSSGVLSDSGLKLYLCCLRCYAIPLYEGFALFLNFTFFSVKMSSVANPFIGSGTHISSMSVDKLLFCTQISARLP